jgi:hypothetical protein
MSLYFSTGKKLIIYVKYKSKSLEMSVETIEDSEKTRKATTNKSPKIYI